MSISSLISIGSGAGEVMRAFFAFLVRAFAGRFLPFGAGSSKVMSDGVAVSLAGGMTRDTSASDSGLLSVLFWREGITSDSSDMLETDGDLLRIGASDSESLDEVDGERRRPGMGAGAGRFFLVMVRNRQDPPPAPSAAAAAGVASGAGVVGDLTCMASR